MEAEASCDRPDGHNHQHSQWGLDPERSVWRRVCLLSMMGVSPVAAGGRGTGGPFFYILNECFVTCTQWSILPAASFLVPVSVVSLAQLTLLCAATNVDRCSSVV